MNIRIKKRIFDKLYEDLKHAEIIDYMGSIWFVDRDKEYCYLEYGKSGTLWWKYPFFNNFFLLFSMDQDEYERVIAEWVEEVLNCKVYTTQDRRIFTSTRLEDVLNCNK
jgi:hypothetical protein